MILFFSEYISILFLPSRLRISETANKKKIKKTRAFFYDCESKLGKSKLILLRRCIRIQNIPTTVNGFVSTVRLVIESTKTAVYKILRHLREFDRLDRFLASVDCQI